MIVYKVNHVKNNSFSLYELNLHLFLQFICFCSTCKFCGDKFWALIAFDRGVATNSGLVEGGGGGGGVGGRFKSRPFLYREYEGGIKEYVSSSC